MNIELDKLCEHMRYLAHRYQYLNSASNEGDEKIKLTARIELLEELLQEVAYIRKEQTTWHFK